MRRAWVVENSPTEGIGLYGTLLAERGYEIATVRAWHGDPLPEPDAAEPVVVGGTPISAYDADRHPWLAAELDWLGRALGSGRPILGICCGAQMIAVRLGGRVYRNPSMEVGAFEATRTRAGRSDPILAGFPDRFGVFHWHADAFETPPGGTLLVEGSPTCREQMFRHGSAIGILFHLELTAADAALWTERYADELPRAGTSAARVVEGCRAIEPGMRELASRLVDNFLDGQPAGRG